MCKDLKPTIALQTENFLGIRFFCDKARLVRYIISHPVCQMIWRRVHT